MDTHIAFLLLNIHNVSVSTIKDNSLKFVKNYSKLFNDWKFHSNLIRNF
jgi:hypothetical protein